MSLKTFHHVAIIGGTSLWGLRVAATVLHSRFSSLDTEVILIAPDGKILDGDSPQVISGVALKLLSESQEYSGSSDTWLSRVKLYSSEKQSFCVSVLPSRLSDLFFLTLVWDRSSDYVFLENIPQIKESILGIITIGNNLSLEFYKRKEFEMCGILQCSVESLTPPVNPNIEELTSCLAAISPCYWVGMLERLCLGLGLGAMKYLDLPKEENAGMVPLNIAIDHLLLMRHFFVNREVFSKLNNSILSPKWNYWHLILHPPLFEGGLCWRMLRMYLFEYLREVERQISSSKTSSLAWINPTTATHGCFKESLTSNLFKLKDLLNSWLSTNSKNTLNINNAAFNDIPHLSRNSFSENAQRIKHFLKDIKVNLTSFSSSAPMLPFSKEDQKSNSSLNSLLSSSEPDHWCIFYADWKNVLADAGVSNNDLWSISFYSVPWENLVKGTCANVLMAVCTDPDLHRLLSPMSWNFPPVRPCYHSLIDYTNNSTYTSPLQEIDNTIKFSSWVGFLPNGKRPIVCSGHKLVSKVGLLNDPNIRKAIKLQVEKKGLVETDVEEESQKIAFHIADNLNHRALLITGTLFHKFISRVFQSIHLSEDTLSYLKFLNYHSNSLLVFIPLHRSYMDFLSVGFLMFIMSLPPPHVCAGEDFLKMGHLSNLMRGCGAFFMRRQFQGDMLYKTIFSAYIQMLVRHGENLEFFIEGMRSRSGKTLTPKFGILNFILKAFLPDAESFGERVGELSSIKNDKPHGKRFNDILFVPLSFSYEHLIEDNLIVRELLNIPKPQESISNLIRGALDLKGNYGSIHIMLGKPISLRRLADQGLYQKGLNYNSLCKRSTTDLLENLPQSPMHHSQSLHPDKLKCSEGDDLSLFLKRNLLTSSFNAVRNQIAWQITFELQRNIHVTPTAILCSALLHQISNLKSLIEDDLSIGTLELSINFVFFEVEKRLNQRNKTVFIDYIHDYCGGISGITQTAMFHLREHIKLSENDKVRRVEDKNYPWINSQIKFQIYSNQLIHLFVEEGIICLAARAVVNNLTHEESFDVDQNTFFQSYCFLRKLLSIEFPNFADNQLINLNEIWNYHLQDLESSATVVNQIPDVLQFHQNPYFFYLTNMLYPFIESMVLVLIGLEAIRKIGKVNCSLNHFTSTLREGIEKWLTKTDSLFLHAANKEMVSNNIRLLRSLKIMSLTENQGNLLEINWSQNPFPSNISDLYFLKQCNHYRYRKSDENELNMILTHFSSFFMCLSKTKL